MAAAFSPFCTWCRAGGVWTCSFALVYRIVAAGNRRAESADGSSTPPRKPSSAMAGIERAVEPMRPVDGGCLRRSGRDLGRDRSARAQCAPECDRADRPGRARPPETWRARCTSTNRRVRRYHRDFPPLKSLNPTGNLPVTISSFVGRVDDVAQGDRRTGAGAVGHAHRHRWSGCRHASRCRVGRGVTGRVRDGCLVL